MYILKCMDFFKLFCVNFFRDKDIVKFLFLKMFKDLYIFSNDSGIISLNK